MWSLGKRDSVTAATFGKLSFDTVACRRKPRDGRPGPRRDIAFVIQAPRFCSAGATVTGDICGLAKNLRHSVS